MQIFKMSFHKTLIFVDVMIWMRLRNYRKQSEADDIGAEIHYFMNPCQALQPSVINDKN